MNYILTAVDTINLPPLINNPGVLVPKVIWRYTPWFLPYKLAIPGRRIARSDVLRLIGETSYIIVLLTYKSTTLESWISQRRVLIIPDDKVSSKVSVSLYGFNGSLSLSIS